MFTTSTLSHASKNAASPPATSSLVIPGFSPDMLRFNPSTNYTAPAHSSYTYQPTSNQIKLPSFQQLLKSTLEPRLMASPQITPMVSPITRPTSPLSRSVSPVARPIIPSRATSPLSTFRPQPVAPISMNTSSPLRQKPITSKVSKVAKPKKMTSKVQKLKEMTSVFVSNPDFQQDIRKHKCGTCDKRFKTQGHLSRHSLCHDLKAQSSKPVKETFKCGDCNSVFNRKDNYSRHLRAHHANISV